MQCEVVIRVELLPAYVHIHWFYRSQAVLVSNDPPMLENREEQKRKGENRSQHALVMVYIAATFINTYKHSLSPCLLALARYVLFSTVFSVCVCVCVNTFRNSTKPISWKLSITRIIRICTCVFSTLFQNRNVPF